jgi:hypothetical protein
MEFLKEGKFILTEAEVVFEAADAVRFGKDIFVTLTHVSIKYVVYCLSKEGCNQQFKHYIIKCEYFKCKVLHKN